LKNSFCGIEIGVFSEAPNKSVFNNKNETPILHFLGPTKTDFFGRVFLRRTPFRVTRQKRFFYFFYMRYTRKYLLCPWSESKITYRRNWRYKTSSSSVSSHVEVLFSIWVRLRIRVGIMDWIRIGATIKVRIRVRVRVKVRVRVRVRARARVRVTVRASVRVRVRVKVRARVRVKVGVDNRSKFYH
jgi:hypothetical protein